MTTVIDAGAVPLLPHAVKVGKPSHEDDGSDEVNASDEDGDNAPREVQETGEAASRPPRPQLAADAARTRSTSSPELRRPLFLLEAVTRGRRRQLIQQFGRPAAGEL